MTTEALFDSAALGAYLHTSVSDDAAESAEAVVWGWLTAATGLTERPDPVPADLYAWALELGAMAYENPTSLTVRQVDDVRMESSEARRDAILQAAANASDVSTQGAPQGSFPCAPTWPDPIQPYSIPIIYN
jgi:hypothetical protein